MKNIGREIITKCNGYFTNPPNAVPSEKVVDGPITGNGDVGIVLCGKPEHQSIWISKNDIWKAEKNSQNNGVRMLGGLDIIIPQIREATYEVEQNIYEAELKSHFSTKQHQVSINTWVSATQNNFFIEISSIESNIEVTVNLWAGQSTEGIQTVGMEKYVLWVKRSFDDPQNIWSTHGVIAAKCINHDLSHFTIARGEKVTIIGKVSTNFDEEDYFLNATTEISKLNEEDVKLIKCRHHQWWEDFWSHSLIQLGDPVLEKFWYGSHYIMACCSRNKAFPPGLFGNWITTDNPAWSGDYHMNYNYSAPWWGVYSSNHVELSETYDTPLLQYIDTGREFSQKLLNCRGIYFNVGIGPKGLNTAYFPDKDGNETSFWGQKSNASFVSVNMLMRFYSTYDLQYAEDTAYPFIKEVGLFWEDYLTFENGRYVIKNDAIHEVPGWVGENLTEEDAKGFYDVNPILSLGLVRAVFRGLLDMSLELKIDSEKRAKWEHILKHISPFPTQERNGQLVFRYTEKGMDWSDSNTLGIQHIWPAGAIGLNSPKELLDISKSTIKELNRWTDYNGFPTIFTAAVRVGYDPDIILENLRKQCLEHSFPNLFIFYGGGGIECCSAIPTCINEMMLQSHEGIIRLFPVWSKNKDAWFYHLRAYGAFLVTAELKNNQVEKLEILSEKGKLCKIQNPWVGKITKVYCIEKDISVLVEAQQKDNVISFDTDENKVYKIEFI